MRIFLLILGYLFFVLGIYCIMGSLSMVISEPFYKKNIPYLIIIVFIELLVIFVGIFLIKKFKKSR